MLFYHFIFVFCIFTFHHHIWGCDIWAFYFSLINVINFGVSVSFLVIIMLLIYTILHHSWECDIYEFFYYLIQGIHNIPCLILIIITVYRIFTFLHHSWGGWYLGMFLFPFSFYTGIRYILIVIITLIISTFLHHTGRCYLIFWYNHFFIFINRYSLVHIMLMIVHLFF